MLDAARSRVLLEALHQTVGTLDIAELDRELARLVPSPALARLAGLGLRAETYFPTPAILNAKPSLLGYYRLLYGYSQKLFYGTLTGCSKFKTMEFSDKVTPLAAPEIVELCKSFAGVGDMLVGGLGGKIGQPSYPDELCLLTLGAQFRGSANNAIGSEGIRSVFAVLTAIFEHETEQSGPRSLEIRSAAGGLVRVELAADPDILIKSQMGDGQDRVVVAIEVKAGEDHSNIWNRVGEAEKSHLKARASAVVECWTIINDAQADEVRLRTASPSTNRFYQLLELTNDKSPNRADFAARVRNMVGM